MMSEYLVDFMNFLNIKFGFEQWLLDKFIFSGVVIGKVIFVVFLFMVNLKFVVELNSFFLIVLFLNIDLYFWVFRKYFFEILVKNVFNMFFILLDLNLVNGGFLRIDILSLV